jgi:hypothetical protein
MNHNAAPIVLTSGESALMFALMHGAIESADLSEVYLFDDQNGCWKPREDAFACMDHLELLGFVEWVGCEANAQYQPTVSGIQWVMRQVRELLRIVVQHLYA